MKIAVGWTGRYPSLCFGNWVIFIDGIKLTGLGTGNFNTYGHYASWHFEDWDTVFDDYVDGEHFSLTWFDKDINGLKTSLINHGIELTDDQKHQLYEEISGCDWRSNSCGGCI